MMYIPGDEPVIGGPCPVSHYCPVGTSTPYACPAGTYNNITGQYECTPCPAGYFCNENTTTYFNLYKQNTCLFQTQKLATRRFGLDRFHYFQK
jgi:hypothetical protein